MKGILVIAVLVMVFVPLLSAEALAAGLEYYGIEATIERNLQVIGEVTLIPLKPVNHIDYELDFTIFNLSADTMSGTSRCDYENMQSGSRITCDLYGMEEERTNIWLTFYTRDAIRRVENDYEFRLDFPVTDNTGRMFSIVRLPAKGVLSEEITNQSYFPPDGFTLTDGKRMMVSWERENLTESDTLSFSVLFEVMNEGSSMWDITVISVTGAVVLIMVLVAVYLRRGSSGGGETEVKVLPLLNKDEKKVVDIMARNGGEARQSLIVKESDYSKAKVSRLVKNLKERGVVDTEPISGRENKVILKIKGVE
jgi:uncharacterized membrane protein